MKKFFEEFKAFALKGNMMDMAIGVIIGGAFSTLVTSLTDNLISPILGILGKVNFDAMMWDVFGDGKLVFKYGAFITAVINFLIMAFVLFCIVKAMNKLMEMGKHEEPAAEEPAAPAAPTQEVTRFIPQYPSFIRRTGVEAFLMVTFRLFGAVENLGCSLVSFISAASFVLRVQPGTGSVVQRKLPSLTSPEM